MSVINWEITYRDQNYTLWQAGNMFISDIKLAINKGVYGD